MNTIKTTLLLTALTLLVVFAGKALGGQQGMVMAFIFAMLMNFSSYWFSDKIVLAIYRAKPVTSSEAPKFHAAVQEISQMAGIPMPKLYMIPQDSPNAFATGRGPNHAAVAVTQGIVQLLSPQELRAVLGHEIGHVVNRDILVSTIAATMAGAISMLAHMAQWALWFGGGRSRDDRGGGHPLAALAMMILAPLAAMLIQMAISRSREYGADATGAKLTGDPLNLASALRKLASYSSKIPLHAQPATAHLFIVNPLIGGGLVHLFSTHPPIEKRVKRLEEMALSGSYH